MSYSLPESVRTSLQRLVSAVDERLQAETHTVSSAMAENEAFEVRWVETDLIRAVIARAACSQDGGSLFQRELPNGGVEATSIEDGVERRFRFRGARLDQDSRPVVRVSSDSMLNPTRRDPNLFGDPLPSPPKIEQWVIPYVLDPRTRTFAVVFAARVIGVSGNQAPYRLRLADVFQIPHTAPLPPGFTADSDDLDMPDEDEGLDESEG